MPNIEDTDQLKLWRGDFGASYIERNTPDERALGALTPMWQRMLSPMQPPPGKVLEVGCNIGLNLRVLRTLTKAELFAVEPNAGARERVVRDAVLPADHIRDGIAGQLPFPDGAVDLAFTLGVLIHIHPDHLAASCREIFRVSSRLILCGEYYSAQPREALYHGHQQAMFLRDYGAFWKETCPSIQLVDYGFFWTGAGALDNITWWLFSK